MLKFIRFNNTNTKRITVVLVEQITLTFLDFEIIIKFNNGEKIKRKTNHIAKEAESKYTAFLISGDISIDFEVF